MFNKKDFDTAVLREVPSKKHYKHIVIGSGPGGAITGCSLAEAGKEVLVLEEGEYFDLDDLKPFSIDEMKYKYRNGGLTLSFGNIKVNYVEGKCVGGGSEVNSGLYHRTPPSVLKRWIEEFNLQKATTEDLEPFYRQCELDVKISFNPGKFPNASLKLADGAISKGWSQQEVPRWFSYNGKFDSFGNAEGTKMSMTQTYLPRLFKSGGKMFPGIRCISIRKFDKYIEVQCSKKGETVIFTCDYVFFCAGAIHTPALLRKSGFKKNIGKSLRMHPTIKVTALFNEVINQEDMGVPVHQVKEFSPQFSFGCSISTPAYLALSMNDHPGYSSLVQNEWNKMGIYYVMTNAEGKGFVKSVPYYRDPLVSYSLTTIEKKHLAEGLRKLCELLFAAGAKKLFPSITDSIALTSENDLSSLPRIIDDKTTNLMTIHLFSSCPMGENKSLCATDSFGRLHNQENIFINDASLLPTALGVNPQGTIMAFAKRNIDHFIQQYK